MMLALISATILLGCTKEDLESCKTLHYITFEYTKNAQFTDKFTSEINTLDVYVFDSKGNFIKCFSDEGEHLSTGFYTMPVDLPKGEYTFVAWGNSRNSYSVFDITNPEQHSLSPNISTYNNSRISLMNGSDAISELPDNLFHGMAQGIKIGPGNLQNTLISLTKNTNSINVTVVGLNGVSRARSNSYVEVLLGAADGEYTFDNSISNSNKLIHYVPVSRTEAANILKTKTKLLHLLSGMKSYIVIRDSVKNEEYFNENLLDLLMRLPDINTDEDLEIYDEYDIVITFDSNLGAKVTVNGYTVINNNVEIQ